MLWQSSCSSSSASDHNENREPFGKNLGFILYLSETRVQWTLKCFTTTTDNGLENVNKFKWISLMEIIKWNKYGVVELV